MLDGMIEFIVNDFDSKFNFRPAKRPVNDIVAIYPDPQVSKAEFIVRHLQSTLGFTTSLVLYRDREVGTWIYTPFVEHGIDVVGRCESSSRGS